MDKEKRKFSEGIDYYLEDGRVHFTKEYLEKRSFCCGGTCRHCPYDKKEKGNNTLRSEN